jgi:hypothetical protein
MTVAELIRELEDMPEDAEVRLAFQPSWPFEHSIDRIVSTDDDESEEKYEIVEALDDERWRAFYIETEDDGTVAGPFATEESAEREVIRLEEHDA